MDITKLRKQKSFVIEEKVQVEEPVILGTLPEEDVFEEIILVEEDEESSL